MKSNYLFILITCLFISCKNNSQSKPSNATSNSIENLFFSKIDILNHKGEITSDYYSNNFNLHKDKNLSIIFTLDKPLIKSLQELAPNLSEEELLSRGNFQFSYMVDGKKLYVENLNVGGGTKIQKTEKLRQEVPLATPERMFFWGWNMWQRFMRRHGGLDSFTEGNHTLSIEVRPYLNGDVLKVGALLAKGSIAVEVPKIVIDESLVPVQRIQPNSGWEISKADINTKKIEALNRKIAEGRFYDVNGIVVVKNGKLLLEEYFNGTVRDSLHNTMSVGKSFASTMIGIAIKEKFIKNEDVLLKDFYDLKTYKNYSAKKDSVTLKSLLTMSSGFLGNEYDDESPGTEDKMHASDNYVKFTLDLPMHKTQVIGKDFSYFTAGTNLLGDIVNKSVPEGLDSYADKKLFTPLGITKYKWFYTPQNIPYTGGGIRMRAIDFAKYGQLYLNKGEWKGKRILTKDWVKKSLAKQVLAHKVHESEYYGYVFWNKTYTINNKAYEISYCYGNGGNKIFIFKDIPLVIVITASAYNIPGAKTDVDKMMIDYILPAVLNP